MVCLYRMDLWPFQGEPNLSPNVSQLPCMEKCVKEMTHDENLSDVLTLLPSGCLQCFSLCKSRTQFKLFALSVYAEEKRVLSFISQKSSCRLDFTILHFFHLLLLWPLDWLVDQPDISVGYLCVLPIICKWERLEMNSEQRSILQNTFSVLYIYFCKFITILWTLNQCVKKSFVYLFFYLFSSKHRCLLNTHRKPQVQRLFQLLRIDGLFEKRRSEKTAGEFKATDPERKRGTCQWIWCSRVI